MAAILAGTATLAACASNHAVTRDAAVGALGGAAVGAVVPGVSVATGALAGAAIGGLTGGVWADQNGDGYVDGYIYNGNYYAGTPAGYDNTLGRVATSTFASAALGATAAAVGTVPGDVVRFMPWPPPVPSSMIDLTPHLSVKGKYADIAKRLSNRLSSRGYDQPLYYGIPGGFAVTTPLERFTDDGHPDETGRFTEGKVGGWRGIRSYLHSLLWGEEGRFRVFVFAVTSERFTPTESAPTETDVTRWESEGTLALPGSIAAKTAPRSTQVTLLIYEFVAKRGREGGVEQAHDRVPSEMHLRWLGFQR